MRGRRGNACVPQLIQAIDPMAQMPAILGMGLQIAFQSHFFNVYIHAQQLRQQFKISRVGHNIRPADAEYLLMGPHFRNAVQHGLT